MKKTKLMKKSLQDTSIIIILADGSGLELCSSCSDLPGTIKYDADHYFHFYAFLHSSLGGMWLQYMR